MLKKGWTILWACGAVWPANYKKEDKDYSPMHAHLDHTHSSVVWSRMNIRPDCELSSWWLKRQKGHNTYIAPPAATAAAAALYVTDRTGIQPIGRRLRSRPPDFNEQPNAVLVCRLMVSTHVIHVILLTNRSQRNGRLS